MTARDIRGHLEQAERNGLNLYWRRDSGVERVINAKKVNGCDRVQTMDGKWHDARACRVYIG